MRNLERLSGSDQDSVDQEMYIDLDDASVDSLSGKRGRHHVGAEVIRHGLLFHLCSYIHINNPWWRARWRSSDIHSAGGLCADVIFGMRNRLPDFLAEYIYIIRSAATFTEKSFFSHSLSFVRITSRKPITTRVSARGFLIITVSPIFHRASLL